MAEVKLAEETFNLNVGKRDLPVFTVKPIVSSKCPALIVVHEIFGLNDHIRDVARRFAKEGLVVYAPDLFAQEPDCPPNEADRNDLDCMRKVWSSIPDSQLISDLLALYKVVQSSSAVRPQATGAIGYCMGGAIALMFACNAPDLAYVVDYYGRIRYPSTSENKPKHPVEYVATLKADFLGIFAGVDELIPQQDREDLADILRKHQVDHLISVFENCPHAFFNDTRDNYRAEAAAEAWAATIAFIERSCSKPGRKLVDAK